MNRHDLSYGLMAFLLFGFLGGCYVNNVIHDRHGVALDRAPEAAEQGYSLADRQALAELMDAENPLLPAVEYVESHGDPNAVSSKGARGRYQIMPETAKHPGMHVKPMRNHSAKEQRRFANDYLNALVRRYGDASLALAAYNAGPGTVDKVLAKMPKETQRYVQKVADYAMNADE